MLQATLPIASHLKSSIDLVIKVCLELFFEILFYLKQFPKHMQKQFVYELLIKFYRVTQEYKDKIFQQRFHYYSSFVWFVDKSLQHDKGKLKYISPSNEHKCKCLAFNFMMTSGIFPSNGLATKLQYNNKINLKQQELMGHLYLILYFLMDRKKDRFISNNKDCVLIFLFIRMIRNYNNPYKTVFIQQPNNNIINWFLI
ncbi:unnamed protein product [Paramecium octaurelia]|uniref:Uncharacterized protein n=1 Tax=Paramecium octaurelia TaxID=43137 RepID=A0A8S1YLC4_PAROT|nr:unnamed protein product [Paramecium octaurelia]